jgi:hypothetical protein
MQLYVFMTSVHSTYSADEVRDTNIIAVGLIFTRVRSGLWSSEEFLMWLCVCVCVSERVREKEIDVDSKTLMMNDLPNFHSYSGACGMLGYTKIKLQTLNTKPIKLKWLCLMDFKRLRRIAKADC